MSNDAKSLSPGRGTIRKLNLRDLVNVLGPFIGLIVVMALFSIKGDVRERFLSLDNISLVLGQTVIVALGALGTTVIIISAGIDLSVGSVIALTSVVAALMIRGGWSPLLAVFAAILLGGAVGVVNGALITGLGVTPFIVTLGMLGIARGAAKWLGHEQSVDAPVTWVNGLALSGFKLGGLSLPADVWITVALAIAMAITLRSTRFGRHAITIGSNETTARLSGLRVDLLKIQIYALGGLFVGLAGVVQFAQIGQGDPTVAIGKELDVIAAVVIGGASLNGGEGSVLGSMLGALIMAFLRNGSVQMEWNSYVQDIIIGAVIVAAVALDRFRHRNPDGASRTVVQSPVPVQAPGRPGSSA